MEKVWCSVSIRTITSFLPCACSHSYLVFNCSSICRCSFYYFSLLLPAVTVPLPCSAPVVVKHNSTPCLYLSTASSDHYNQHPTVFSLLYNYSLPNNPASSHLQSPFSLFSLVHFINHLCLHFPPLVLFHISLCHATPGRKTFAFLSLLTFCSIEAH